MKKIFSFIIVALMISVSATSALAFSYSPGCNYHGNGVYGGTWPGYAIGGYSYGSYSYSYSSNYAYNRPTYHPPGTTINYGRYGYGSYGYRYW